MRLISLYIDHYQMLHDLTLRFDQPGRLNMGAYALDFLVGLNGSGKSTFLRALTRIVTDLHANRPTPFNYQLQYEIARGDERFRVSIVRERPQLTMAVTNLAPDGASLDSELVDATYLPERVVVYSTGGLDLWDALADQTIGVAEVPHADQSILSDPAKRTIVELPGGLPHPDTVGETDAVESPLLLLRESGLSIIALTGILASFSSISNPLQGVLASLSLSEMRGFSLKFRLHQALSDYDVFNQLKLHAVRHIQQGSDHLLVFELPNEREAKRQFIGALWENYATPLAFYDALDQLSKPLATGEPTLQQVNIFLERTLAVEEEDEDDATRLLLFDWLSDGEQSFLGRMAMLAMLQTDNSLILLDEPEVHFNDYWKREIVNLLDLMMLSGRNHLLIATHSSIVLSDVTDAHINLLARNEQGWSEPMPFILPSLGANPSDLMVHVFDTETAAGAFSARYLQEALERDDGDELLTLLEQVGIGYWYFRILDRLESRDAS